MPLVSQLSPTSVDHALVDVCALLQNTPKLPEIVGKALRKSFDEVIDGARTGRYRIEQLEKTEKTYIGTKVEIVLRAELEMTRGTTLDNLICGHEVDTKFSLTGGWMIPREAIDHLCLLIQGDDNNRLFKVGILRMTSGVLTNGANQDGKKSVSAEGKKNINWIVSDGIMPENILLNTDSATREMILSQSSGVQRIKALFRSVTGRLIPRTVIEQVAQQKDPTRRARQMKSVLKPEGFEVLCATYKADREKITAHGFSNFNDDDWVSIKQN